MLSKKTEKTFYLRPPSPNFSLISDNFWPTKNRPFFILISPQNDLFLGSYTKFCWPSYIFTQSVKFFPFFGGIPYILKIGFVMDGQVLTEATVFSSRPDQITFVIQLCLLSLSVGGSGLWLRDTGHIPRHPVVVVAVSLVVSEPPSHPDFSFVYKIFTVLLVDK